MRLLPILVLALTLPVATSCKKDEEKPEPAPISKDDIVPTYGIPFKCEEHWLLSLVARDIDRIRGLADGGDAGPDRTMENDDSGGYRLDGFGEINPSPSVWHLETWSGLTESISPPAEIRDPESILPKLLTPDARTIEDLNLSLSAALADAPDQPGLHEQSALLLGAWALTEQAGGFTDLRRLLCRMTAHLAVARQLRPEGGPTLDGRWADLLFDYHRGLKLEASNKLPTLRDESASPPELGRALDVFIRRDWRVLRDSESLTLLEAMAQCRALNVHHSSGAAMDLVRAHEVIQASPYWCRVFFANIRSVEEGHLCRELALPLEFQELDAIFPIDSEKDFRETLPAVLNTESPDSLVSDEGAVAVISKGDWAASFRRHLFLELCQINRFMLYSWGVQEAADEWRKELEPFYSKLSGYDTCAPLFTTGARAFLEAGRGVHDAIIRDPRMLTGYQWSYYRRKPLRFDIKVRAPREFHWFKVAVPPETAYNGEYRITCRTTFGDDWNLLVRSLSEKDPWDSDAAFYLANLLGNDSDALKTAYAKLSDFSIRALRARRNAEPSGSDEQLAILAQMRDIDPEYGLELGILQALRGDEDDAAKSMEAGFEEADDRVAVSSQTRWLIHHHLSRGNTERAREIAEHNVEVYSQLGLVSGLLFAMHEGDRERSKELAEAIDERYDDPVYHLIVDTHFSDSEPRSLKMLFPEGRQQVTLQELRDEGATAGMRIASDSSIIESLPSRVDDVILAVDGIRVKSFPQYIFLVDSTIDPKHRIIVRRGAEPEYLEFEANLPNGRFNCDLRAVE